MPICARHHSSAWSGSGVAVVAVTEYVRSTCAAASDPRSRSADRTPVARPARDAPEAELHVDDLARPRRSRKADSVHAAAPFSADDRGRSVGRGRTARARALRGAWGGGNARPWEGTASSRALDEEKLRTAVKTTLGDPAFFRLARSAHVRAYVGARSESRRSRSRPSDVRSSFSTRSTGFDVTAVSTLRETRPVGARRAADVPERRRGARDRPRASCGARRAPRRRAAAGPRPRRRALRPADDRPRPAAARRARSSTSRA